ncbi:hypothetical protein NBE98_19715 [Clostridium swellfunianum]|uniref:hypothetical protein n=1 Tax=Clostridium swellfunianum TaxID=1367462 RepID=UPI00202EA90E|nr:hypothetical protein [Clostridium swellfunianum]MCM0650598.1 hypothetical protein [Clostridium swellfunianum]
MLEYKELSDETIEIIKTYVKKGESCRISGQIVLNNKVYREIIFYKRNLRTFRNENQGYLYLDENNSIVSSKNIQKELAKLAQYYDVFFSDGKNGGILAALQTEEQLEREKGHMEDIITALEFLSSEGIEGAVKIKDVVYKLPEAREKANKKVNELALLIKNVREENNTFDEAVLQKIYPVYEDVLKLNFEKVRLIGTLYDCCDYVKEQAERQRKKWKIRFKSKLVGPLLKLSDEISYFRRVIRTYEKVLNMNTSQYVKFLNNINKEKIENRFNMVRI